MAQQFVVRPLQSQATSLDGAFRVHISPESLEKSGLKVGDLCEIYNEHGTTAIGYGISWRATDKMGNSPKVSAAKMTSTLRDAFAIDEGTHINLYQTKAKIAHAQKVTLTDVTPKGETDARLTELDDNKWKTRCASMLVNCEAFASGITFDVTPKKGLRKRYYIESVETSNTQSESSSLYFCDDDTQITISDGAHDTFAPTWTGMPKDTLAKDYIGGLQEQLQALNEHMKLVLNQAKYARREVDHGVLLHGYEGTGKSLILKRMEHSQFRKVLHLQKSSVNTGSSSKNTATIESIFKDAKAHQPSLVLIDDINKIAPAGEDSCSDAIAKEMDDLAGSRVLVVAACRNPSDVNDVLLDPSRFSALVELQIPDQKARQEILNVLFGKQNDHDRVVASTMSARTHGFTGRDLARLVRVADTTASRRHLQQHEHMEERLAVNGSSEIADDGQSEQQANGDISVPESTLEDFEFALKKVRPTALREIFFEQPKIRWNQIGGSQAIKERFDKIVDWPIHHAEAMKLYRQRPTRGILLYGPPGCSKTLTVQAIASTYDLNFIPVKGAELISMYVGESERQVREIFRKARSAAPCVIFFDEIDSIASKRESEGTKGLNVLTTLLNEMDGFESLKDVLVLAATNKPETLDHAIMRPGRFDAHVYLGLPNEQARKEILDMCLKDINKDVALEKLVSSTKGYSGAEIVSICNLATEEAMGRYIDGRDGTVHMADFEAAIGQTKKGISQEMLDAYAAFANA